MLELPESIVLAQQLNESVRGKRVEKLSLGGSPHKFFFTEDDGVHYAERLEGRRLGDAKGVAIYVEIAAEDSSLLFGDGINLRYLAPGQAVPKKWQILVNLEDGSALVGTVQMYGGAWVYPAGSFDNPYYLSAAAKRTPLTDDFDRAYFDSLADGLKPTMSAKAFLATEQRIPGLGNGCLQDILFRAHVHPKRKLASITDAEMGALYDNVKGTLREMTDKGGRNTEKDLYGQPGGYTTTLSAKTWKEPCPVCGGAIEKQAYLGGSVYFCSHCQPL